MIKNNYLNKNVIHKALIININRYIKNYNIERAISLYFHFLKVLR